MENTVSISYLKFANLMCFLLSENTHEKNTHHDFFVEQKKT